MALLTKSMVPGADSQITTRAPTVWNCAHRRRPRYAHARRFAPPSAGRAARLVLEVPSVGLAAARAMEPFPEKEYWRQIAREWYAKDLAGTPGAGKLHHHIGLLCRERDGSGEELWGMYHFVKSMITVHLNSTSREAILQIWSPAAQTRRQGPDAGVAANVEDRNVEVEVLDKSEGGDQLGGIIEGEREENEAANELGKRWIRVARAGLKIAKHVGGFAYYPAANEEQRGQWKVEGVLAAKVAQWQEEEKREREEEERRLRGRRWDEDSMDADDDEGLAAEELADASEDGENGAPEIKALKARRRYLQSLLDSSAQGRVSPSIPRRRPRGPQPHKPARPQSTLRVVPGYTILVIDTNILLSSLPVVSTLVESLQWTVVIPLLVVMELDGLASNATALGEAAPAALAYITSHSCAGLHYFAHPLSHDLAQEQVDFAGDGAPWEWNMDDLILRAAIWQDEHWIDRSAMLQPDGVSRDTSGAAKVVLLNLIRISSSHDTSYAVVVHRCLLLPSPTLHSHYSCVTSPLPSFTAFGGQTDTTYDHASSPSRPSSSRLPSRPIYWCLYVGQGGVRGQWAYLLSLALDSNDDDCISPWLGPASQLDPRVGVAFPWFGPAKAGPQEDTCHPFRSRRPATPQFARHKSISSAPRRNPFLIYLLWLRLKQCRS
ncbi:hypothetical protein EVJ58_g9086 [Rhodofomes roseus]|uniref:PIN domain-containing protein n=1 Tax=Rhodofomes roseus TaxID=34475 RepID=A0A4Y9XUW1_9APHY|nr:hypothetical protein EVJ58_g9086 [Rhodofomes roseus]